MGVRIFGIAGSTNSAEDFRLAASGLFVPASQINARTGTLSVPVLTGTGSFTCTVGAFSCVIDGTSNSLQGYYWATLDAATTVTINAANTQARIDLIGLQIQDDAYDGSSQHQGIIVYVAGTPGSGSAPSTPANTIPLFNVPVAANASSVNFASATAVYPYTAAAGGTVPVRSAADKPAVVNGMQLRWRLDVTAAAGSTSPLEGSVDGVTYRPIFDASVVPASTTAAITAAAGYGTWTNAGIGTAFNTVVQPQYRTAPGNRIELRGRLISNTSFSSNTGVLSSIPAPSTSRALPLPNSNAAAFLNISGGATHAEIMTDAGITFNRDIGFDGLSYSL